MSTQNENNNELSGLPAKNIDQNLPKHLQGLNDQQLIAATHIDGPLLILAGAGAGKTKTITHRILNLIHKGVEPSKILAITFTNKAAKEMRERVEHLITSDTSINLHKNEPVVNRLPSSVREMPFVSTFHSLGVHILKENSARLGLTRHFSIYDRADSKRAIKDAMEKFGIDPKQHEPGKILAAISKEKGDFVSHSEYEAKMGSDFWASIVAPVWREYDSILAKEKALDFDDLLFKTASLLEREVDVRKHYQDVWQYVHIDEYQDTNKVQYTIARLITGPKQNIVAVGDIDQSIYGWRGADIKNILKFEEDYADTETVLLEENYRSTQTILSVANDVIKKNIFRREKNLFTKNAKGEQVGFYTGFDEGDEANFVANTSRQLISNGVSPKEIAVLYRANFQSRVLEDSFLTKNIPYQMLGTKFFERKEIKDVLAYIRAALNEDSLSDIKRVINVPARGIGKVTLLKIFEGNEHTLPQGTREKIQSFRMLLGRIRDRIFKEKPSEVVKYVLRESGLESMYRQGKEEDQEKLENMHELATLALKYDLIAGGLSGGDEIAGGMGLLQPEKNTDYGAGIEELLKDAALQSDQDNIDGADEKNKNAVKLMTIHASKGLEFDYVFITGLEEGLFPHSRASEGKESGSGGGAESEEERRLFYVALTRARKKIYLSHAQMRTIFGSKQVAPQSSFINDVDKVYLEEQEPPSGAKLIFIDF